MSSDFTGFWEFASLFPGRTAVTGDRTTTFGELRSLVNRLSHGLRAQGLGVGDVVATTLPNVVDHLALMLATEQIGLRLVQISPRLTATEVGHLLEDSGAELVVHTIDDLVAGQPDDAPADRAWGQIMPYTSGTTGRAKGVRKPLLPTPPEPVIGFIGASLRARFDFTPGSGVHLVTAALHHTAHGSFALHMLHMGYTVVLMDRFDAEEALRLIDEHQVTSTQVAPIMFHRWLRLPEEVRVKYDLSSLRQVLHAGAPCPVGTKHAMIDWLGLVVYEYYSSSEGGLVSVRPHEWLVRPGTVGRPEPGEVVILGESGDEVPCGQTGLVYLKVSPVLPFEYHNDADRTAAAIHGDHFTVGDLGHVDEEGWLFLDDRRVDMINSGGVNLYPAEIEGAFLQHPAVADVGVIGVPDPEWGQRAVALVELTADAVPEERTAGAIEEDVRQRLASHKVPRIIEFRTSLGRQSSGKLSRAALRATYLEAL